MIDHATIFRAMRAAGLDPTNKAHVERFAKLMQDEVQKLPERALARFQEGDMSEAAASAANRAANEDQAAKMRRFGQENNPNELWKLTDISAANQSRRNEIAKNAQREQNDGPLPNDPTELWKLSRG